MTPGPIRARLGESPKVIVTAAARTAWRSVGTTAWGVLQDVALDVEVDTQGRLVAATNVRRIAGHLDISKDTVARALVRLADAGLLVRQHRRRGANGEFVPSVYELRLDHGGGMNLVLPAQARRPVPADAEVEPVPAAASRPSEQVQSNGREYRARRSQRRVPGLAQRSLFENSSDLSEHR